MDRTEAETLALRVLTFLAADEKRMRALTTLSGVGPATLKGKLDDPGVLGGVLDFLLSDERLLVEFAKETGLSPTLPARALRALSGGGDAW